MYQVEFIATRSAGWAQAIALIDGNNDQPFDASVIKIEMEVRSLCGGRELFISTEDGTIERPRADVIQWRFTPDQFRRLTSNETYRVGAVMTAPSGTTQLFVGTLALSDGEIH